MPTKVTEFLPALKPENGFEAQTLSGLGMHVYLAVIDVTWAVCVYQGHNGAIEHQILLDVSNHVNFLFMKYTAVILYKQTLFYRDCSPSFLM